MCFGCRSRSRPRRWGCRQRTARHAIGDDGDAQPTIRPCIVLPQPPRGCLAMPSAQVGLWRPAMDAGHGCRLRPECSGQHNVARKQLRVNSCLSNDFPTRHDRHPPVPHRSLPRFPVSLWWVGEARGTSSTLEHVWNVWEFDECVSGGEVTARRALGPATVFVPASGYVACGVGPGSRIQS